MKAKCNFLLVDNDPLNNMLNKILIHHIEKNSQITVFTNPEEALSYIENIDTPVKEKDKTILLLDLIMPEMDGWEFLDKFHKFPGGVHSGYDTYILSSSIDTDDSKRAASNPLIKGFLEKPLSTEFLQDLFASRTMSGIA